jgi:hypothetical protein
MAVRPRSRVVGSEDFEICGWRQKFNEGSEVDMVKRMLCSIHWLDFDFGIRGMCSDRAAKVFRRNIRRGGFCFLLC